MVQTWTEIDVHAVPSGPAATVMPRAEGASRHLVQRHEQGLFPDAAVAEYLRAAIQAGEGALLEHAAAVCASLVQRGASIDELARRGHPVVLDARPMLEAMLDRSVGGLGLGLALVEIFTELRGGMVLLERGGAGQGSTFTVRVPAGAAVGAREIDAGSEPRASAKRSGSRVLIVDDNEDASELLAETLSNAGYEIAVACDGPEALRSAAASPPDVALIDIGLPVMDGYELAARLREARPPGDLRLIALTGYGQESDRERSRNVGFDLHLVKPVDLDTLMRAIEAPAE